MLRIIIPNDIQLFYFAWRIRFDISRELRPQLMIHMKWQGLVCQRKIQKKKMFSATEVISV